MGIRNFHSKPSPSANSSPSIMSISSSDQSMADLSGTVSYPTQADLARISRQVQLTSASNRSSMTAIFIQNNPGHPLIKQEKPNMYARMPTIFAKQKDSDGESNSIMAINDGTDY